MHGFKRHDTSGSDFGKGVIGGLLGGFAATWAMGLVMSGAKKLQQQREASADDGSAYQHAWNSSGEEGGKEPGEGEAGRHAQNGASDESGADAADDEQDDSATVATAKRISRKVFHHELTEQQEATAGQAVHYGFGTTMGAMYGAAAEMLPEVTCGGGLPFGAGLWLVADEVAVPALHLAPPPQRTPLMIHGGALLAHLVYGAVLEGVRSGVRRWW